MKKLYVVQYNDCYGNGDSSLEVIVESHEDFLKWLEQHNDNRDIEEREEEFKLIPLNIW